MADGLAARNAEAAMQAIRDMDSRLREQQKKLEGMHSLLGTMSARLGQLERELLLLRARAAGTGPSER